MNKTREMKVLGIKLFEYTEEEYMSFKNETEYSYAKFCVPSMKKYNGDYVSMSNSGNISIIEFVINKYAILEEKIVFKGTLLDIKEFRDAIKNNIGNLDN